MENETVPTPYFRMTTLAGAMAIALLAGRVAVSQQIDYHDEQPSAPAAAAGKPVAVIAINSYEKLMQDVDYLGSLVNIPSASQMVNGIVGQVTGGKGLAGLDQTRPIGLMLDMSSMSPSFAAYVPVTDQDALLALLAPMHVTTQDMGNGIVQVNAMGQDVYARNVGGWTLVSMSPDMVGAMPADPGESLASLTAQYDVAIQINVQGLPEAYRQQATQAFVNAQGSLTKLPNEDDAAFAARQEALQQEVAATQQAFNELDQMTIGLAIAGEQQKVYLDVNVLAVPGSKLAAEMAANPQPTTNFAGFQQPDAAARLSFAGKTSGTHAAQLEQMIATLRMRLSAAIDQEVPEAQRNAVRDSLGQIVDAVVETVKAGSIDGGAVVLMAPNSATVVAGGLIVDPSKIEAGLKNLSTTLAQAGKDEMPEIHWGAETHGDIALHTMQVPVKDNDGKAMFGDQMDIVVGLGGQSAYVAWGRNSIEALKQVIDANAASPGQAIAPFELTVTLGRILESIKSIAPPQGKANLEMISGIVAGAAGQDHVHMIAQSVENGGQFRIEAEHGVLQAIGTAVMMRQMGPPPGAAGPAEAPPTQTPPPDFGG